MSAHLLEDLIGRRQTSLLARESLPALYRDIDIDRRQLDGETGAPVISAAMMVVPEPLKGS